MAVTVIMRAGEEHSSFTVRDGVSIEIGHFPKDPGAGGQRGSLAYVVKDAQGNEIGKFNWGSVVGYYTDTPAPAVAPGGSTTT